MELKELQQKRLDNYFKDGVPDQRYYDFTVSIVEEDGFIDEELVRQFESYMVERC